MIEDINQIRERHKQEIDELQKNCKHKKLSDWIEEWWVIGHSTGSIVKVYNTLPENSSHSWDEMNGKDFS